MSTELRNANGVTLREGLEAMEKWQREEGAICNAELLKWAREEIEDVRRSRTTEIQAKVIAYREIGFYTTPRPISEYHEGMGDVLWWRFPIVEPPYRGSPNCCGFMVETAFRQFGEEEVVHRHMVGGWPGYHTHFTPIPEVKEP